MEEILTVLVWRLTWWLVRILWLPFLVIGFALYVVVPAFVQAGELLLTPNGLLLIVLLAVWLWRPRRGRGRHE